MLILDRNNEPTSTVYYLAAALRDRIMTYDGIDASSLYECIIASVIRREVSYEFFIMALDFLFLLGVVDVDEIGGLHVYQVD